MRKPRDHPQRGAQLVEMALVLFLLLMLLGGVVDVGRAFNKYIIITNAAREGARYGSHFPADDVGIRKAARDEAAQAGVDLADSNVIISRLGGIASGQPIKVRVEWSVSTVMVGILRFGSIPMANEVQMIIYGVHPGSP